MPFSRPNPASAARTLWLLATTTLLACEGAATAVDSTSAVARIEPPIFSKVVVFGDSYSDVGTYRTAGVASVGGGRFTVNGDGAALSVELLAGELAVPAPCPAQTGLAASGPLSAFAAPVEDHPGCFDFAQGGARVTHPIGPWNAALLALGDPSGALGQLTDPVVHQIARYHLASGGSFRGDELVVVWAGSNDVLMNLGAMQASVAEGTDPAQAAAWAIAAVGQAGGDLAAAVHDELVARGATHVIVLNLPDPLTSPAGRAASPASQRVLSSMVEAFHAQLDAGLAGMPEVLRFDVHALSRDAFARPSRYGLSDVRTPACDPEAMPFPSTLVCTESTVIDVDADGDVDDVDVALVRRFLFADSTHVTPYAHYVIASAVADAMTDSGWLAPRGLRPCRSTGRGCPLDDSAAWNARAGGLGLIRR